MKNNDIEILDKAAELQRLACSDYNSIYNSIAGTNLSLKILTILYDELKNTENVKTMLRMRTDVNQQQADKNQIDSFLNEMKNLDITRR